MELRMQRVVVQVAQCDQGHVGAASTVRLTVSTIRYAANGSTGGQLNADGLAEEGQLDDAVQVAD